MGNTVLHPTESHGSDEEDDENQVGEESRYIDNLGALCDSLHHGQIHQDPAEDQAESCKRMLIRISSVEG